MEHVSVDGIEVHARGPVLVTEGPASVRVGLEVRADPVAQLTRHRDVDKELHLGGKDARFTAHNLISTRSEVQGSRVLGFYGL